ncbi:hypothetical protein QA601_02925 [Chitinispirillales bacterium ANBcel5]|uniref:hypothetical protein n=1 Tax=Cellulosispirillum alkaliphilum TaxID=3039283 RepID=UPI002A5752A8|nr:hypothetical protein [Chitinispirillales bacterium ANBcel5]
MPDKKICSLVVPILSISIVAGGFLYLIVSTICFMSLPVTNITRGKELTALVLPVISAWVGAVIAYYFSKENYSSATKQTKELLSVKDRLRASLVKDCMIPKKEIDFLDACLPKSTEEKKDWESEITLKDLHDKFQVSHKTRMPILKDGYVCYVIRKSILYEFLFNSIDQIKIVKKNSITFNNNKIANCDDDNIENLGAKIKCSLLSHLTLRDLIKDKNYKDKVKAMVFVCTTDTLEAVQKRMSKKKKRVRDAFVTEDGDPESELWGWVTNANIAKVAGLEAPGDIDLVEKA